MRLIEFIIMFNWFRFNVLFLNSLFCRLGFRQDFRLSLLKRALILEGLLCILYWNICIAFFFIWVDNYVSRSLILLKIKELGDNLLRVLWVLNLMSKTYFLAITFILLFKRLLFNFILLFNNLWRVCLDLSLIHMSLWFIYFLI
jgi:hypothetical protein